MKALSILQPWAWLIVNGYKDIENRDWKPANPALKFRGRALIHTGRDFDHAGYDAAAAILDRVTQDHGLLPERDELERGGIVGVATFIGPVRTSASPWFFGPIGLVIQAAKAVPFTPMKGALGFFDVPREIFEQVKARL